MTATFIALDSLRGLRILPIFLLEKTGEYARVAKAAIRKMKRVEQDYKSLLVQYKETKCEVEIGRASCRERV